MRLNITFRNLDATEALKQYASEKIDRVQRYLDRAGEAHIVLSLERHLHHADISIHAGTFLLRGREKSEDMYASIDLALEKIERQLRRYKEKLKRHHGRERVHHRQEMLNHRRVRYDVLEAPAPEEQMSATSQPRVIRTNEIVIKPMTLDEAVMQLDLMNSDILVFTNSASHQMNVVYRRKDGHFGLIEPTADNSASSAQPKTAV